jgi:hypothetical protein
MGGFNNLFGGLANLLGGLSNLGGENPGEAIAGGLEAFRGEADDGDGDEDATYTRHLTGAKRALNINDI